MASPDGWRILNEELWHLSDADSTMLWGALCRARYVRPVTLRQQLSLVGHVVVTEALLAQFCGYDAHGFYGASGRIQLGTLFGTDAGHIHSGSVCGW
jgi:hypothetical protein